MTKSTRNEPAMRMTNKHAKGMADRRPFYKKKIGILWYIIAVKSVNKRYCEAKVD